MSNEKPTPSAVRCQLNIISFEPLDCGAVFRFAAERIEAVRTGREPIEHLEAAGRLLTLANDQYRREIRLVACQRLVAKVRSLWSWQRAAWNRVLARA